eukprot:COSAG06_NODE_2354_length_7021_cov_10.485264_5_plen_55_part_00
MVPSRKRCLVMVAAGGAAAAEAAARMRASNIPLPRGAQLARGGRHVHTSCTHRN